MYKLITMFDELAYMSEHIKDIYSFLMIIQWKSKETGFKLQELYLYKDNEKKGIYSPLSENSNIYVFENYFFKRNANT